MAGTQVVSFIYDPDGGVGYKNMSSTLQMFVETARHCSAMSRNPTAEAYLDASNTLLLDVNSTIALSHADLPGMKVNFSRIRLDGSTFADALTLDIPYGDAVSTRKVEFGWSATTNTSTVSWSANPGSNTYEFPASSDCGPTTCASQPLDFFTTDHQAQVLQICVDPETRIETFDLVGVDKECESASAYSSFFVGVNSRIESDRNTTLGPSPDSSTQGFPSEFDFNNSQKAFATNVRRYRTISIVKLT